MQTKSICIGVLALQGDFSKHLDMLNSLGISTCEVRQPLDLQKCDGLIIPGGESTVMQRQIDFIDLRQALIDFAKQKPLFGTCAGLILMAKEVKQSAVRPLELLNIVVKRNAYGRQVNSFQTMVSIYLDNKKSMQFPAFFIRAPKICSYGKNVEVLASLQDEPILVRQNLWLAATFHPELTTNSCIHQYFINMVKSFVSKERDVQ